MPGKKGLTFSERFWSKVDRNGPTIRPEFGPCWIWTAATDKRGYGMFQIRRGVTRRAARVVYEMEVGPLEDGKFACHHCDNPPCVRPLHLFPGTALDNKADEMAKGRHAVGVRHGRYGNPRGTFRGESHWNATVTVEQVLAIRAKAATGLTKTEIAAQFAIGRTAVSAIVRRRTWRHV